MYLLFFICFTLFLICQKFENAEQHAGAGSFVDDAFQRESHDEAAVSSALVGNRRTRSRIVLHRREGVIANRFQYLGMGCRIMLGIQLVIIAELQT